MAELFRWSREFNVGIAPIDEQHVELVGLLNRLHAAVREQRGVEAVRDALDELVACTLNHFADEERLMSQARYPAYAEHRIHHEALTAQVRALQRRLESGETTISFELLDFLRVWLMRHIGESDRRFGEWYHREGAGRAGESPWWCFWK
ncbi:bacteriohemerythrin [Pseudothauera nasutitermitis]|uniref:Bacteriohemerythrin n=1 Tax=Pseudothauera nasutitermitis TaxID=2565930 RepID=A0A4S4B488_9RHOO|nr:bacteriohemerythrin [Pseudothauera nasutitermitis]THF65734.1 bacteriohemerythrin [Pseudothauera nasutitermitis]